MLKFGVNIKFMFGGAMGIFSKFFKLFSKNIECSDDQLSGRIVFAVPLKGRIVNVGASIVVNDGYNAVFVVNDRVADVLPSGKHKIGGATLPTTFSRLKLDKPNKNGNYEKKFKADVYYVCMQTFTRLQYSSSEPFYARSDKFGRIKGYAEGVCSLRVEDAEKLLKVLLIDRPYINNREVTELITNLVGNEVNSMLEKNKVSFTEIILNPQVLSKYLNPAISEKTNVFGVELDNVEVASLKLNRRLQKKVSEFLSERSNLEKQFEQTGVKFDAESLSPPQTVEVGNSAATMQQNSVQSTNNDQMHTGQPSAPQIIKRGGNVSAPNANTNYESKNLNSNSEILDGETKKVCKFCGETIDSRFAFCPKCGFKQ